MTLSYLITVQRRFTGILSLWLDQLWMAIMYAYLRMARQALEKHIPWYYHIFSLKQHNYYPSQLMGFVVFSLDMLYFLLLVN